MKKLVDFFNDSRPKNSFLNKIIILGPYPSNNFIKEIISVYSPKNIVLIVDNSATQSATDIKKSIPQNIKFTLRYVTSQNSGGLVHSKIYLLKWETRNNKFKRVLFLGSANASINGFFVNSEALQSIPISSLEKKSKKRLKEYLSSLCNGNDVNSEILKLNSESNIWLPTILTADENNIGFDGWVRKGILCHKFDKESTFGKLNIHLKKPLPKTVHESAFAKHGFAKKTKKEILSRNYVKISSKRSSPRWKGLYFTETWFGHWASYECYQDAHNDKIMDNKGNVVNFVLTDNKVREEAIEEILNAKHQKTSKWKNECISELSKVYKNLINKNKEPKLYFKLKNDKIDESFYTAKMDEKIKRDQKKAKINSFKERYISGYDFHKLPSLGEADKEFMIGLCDSLLNSGFGTRVVNKLSKSLINCLGDKFYQANDGEELYEVIQKQWDEISEEVMCYHELT